MGVKTMNSNGGGYTLFDKGENVYVKPAKIETGWNDREDEPQLNFEFLAVSTENKDGESGRIPGYLSPKITIQEDEGFNSFLGNLLVYADIAEAVLEDLGVDEDDISGILNPEDDRRYEAETEEENRDLYAAIVGQLSEMDSLVLKAGTKQAGKNGDYSKISGIYKRVDEDPFSEDPADYADTDSDGSESDAASEDEAAAELA